VANLLLGHVAPLSPSTAVALGRDKELRAMLSERSVELADDTHWLRGGLLAVAIRHGRQDMAQLLIDSGWDINEPARVETVERDAVSSGRPLWDAAANRDYDSVEMLLQRGADPNVMVYASGGAMERAYNNRDEKMKELLRRHGAGTSPETLGLFRDTEGARAYLQAGPDEDEIRRLLWAAACGGDPETVRMCLPLLKWQRDRSEWFNLLEQPFRM
jgi:ankyrin repeat protein